MRLPSLILLLSCLPVSAAPYGETTRTAFGKLKEALLADANNTVPGEGTAERRLYAAQMQIRRLEQALEQGTEAWTTFEQMGDGIQSAYKSPAVRETWGILLKTAGEESQRSRQSAEEQTASLIARLKTLVETTMRPEHFDEIILQLDPAGFTGRNEGTPLYRKLESSRSFAIAWQEYLSAKTTGNQSRINQSLSQLLGSGSIAGQFIPRSKLLQEQSDAMVNGIPAERVAAILDSVKALEDLNRAIREINQLMSVSRGSGSSDQNVTYLAAILSGMERFVAESEAGLSPRLELLNNPLAQHLSFGYSEVVLVRIRSVVLRAFISRYIANATTGEILPEESIEAYTKRALKNALADGDLDALTRLASFSAASFSPGARPGMVDYGSSSLDMAMRQAASQSLTSCFAARNFEAAGDPLSAVIAWHAALKSGSPYTPAAYIGQRLAAIKQANPEIYARAMDKALNPPPLPGQSR